jgi:hypothetical protein
MEADTLWLRYINAVIYRNCHTHNGTSNISESESKLERRFVNMLLRLVTGESPFRGMHDIRFERICS